MGGMKAPEDLLKKIRLGNRFLLTSHINPDGDAIGSGLGLARLLRSMGKGAVVWNRFIRPSEEAFLRKRFGEPYLRYQRHVRCWVPTWPPYRPAPTTSDSAANMPQNDESP